MSTVAGFPYWELEFNQEGQPVRPSDIDRFLAEVPRNNITDLFVFSHGWNNDHDDAHSLYERFFDRVRQVQASRGMVAGVTIGVAGVIWPSILFPDDAPAKASGGAASLGGVATSTDAFDELRKVFPDKIDTLDELSQLLQNQPRNRAALDRFHALLQKLAPASSSAEDSGEQAVLHNSAESVFNAMADVAPPAERVVTAGIGDIFERLWSGAKEALRATSYWNMKERAGLVGERGLGSVIARLHQATPKVRVHLIGHSFGARLVSFSLKGLPDNLTGTNSPIKSLTLLQGAFSHFAFADKLPQDPDRAGALQGMAARVDGPITVSHSKHDLAVAKRYPQASLISRDDAAAFEDIAFRFGGMGADGAQAVAAAADSFNPVGRSYNFVKGRFLNLDGNQLITQGDPPSGAHSDIFYQEIAWAVMLAAGVVK